MFFQMTKPTIKLAAKQAMAISPMMPESSMVSILRKMFINVFTIGNNDKSNRLAIFQFNTQPVIPQTDPVIMAKTLKFFYLRNFSDGSRTLNNPDHFFNLI